LQRACLRGFSSKSPRGDGCDARQSGEIAEMADSHCIAGLQPLNSRDSSRPTGRSGYDLLRPRIGVAKRAFARHAPARRSLPARPEVNMRKLATAVAVAFAALSAQAALACDEKVERAEQPQQKPAVAEKAQKQNKQQQKAKKADTSQKTAVARADK
jgi:hypothetical protein